MLNEPDPNYHGAVWTQAVKPLGPIAYIIKARVTLLRDCGQCMSPFNAYNFIQGLETLPLRLERHSQYAFTVAKFLENHPKVSKFIFPLPLSLILARSRFRIDGFPKEIHTISPL